MVSIILKHVVYTNFNSCVSLQCQCLSTIAYFDKTSSADPSNYYFHLYYQIVLLFSAENNSLVRKIIEDLFHLKD